MKLEVDLLDKGVDLLDFYRGRLSLRRLLILAVTLPITSLTKQALYTLQFGEKVRWSDQDFILMDIANSLRYANYMTEAKAYGQADDDNRRKMEEPEFPEFIHEPGYEEPEEELEFASPEEIMLFFGALNRK